jgi:hypothetical protein
MITTTSKTKDKEGLLAHAAPIKKKSNLVALHLFTARENASTFLWEIGIVFGFPFFVIPLRTCNNILESHQHSYHPIPIITQNNPCPGKCNTELFSFPYLALSAGSVDKNMYACMYTRLSLQALPKIRSCKAKTPGLATAAFIAVCYSHSHSHTVSNPCIPFVFHFAHRHRSHSFSLLQHSLRALVHTLIHESEETHRASANAHAVNEAGSEERAEDGAEVGVGDLLDESN